MANMETKVTVTAVDKASPVVNKIGQSIDRLKQSAASIGTSFSAMGNAAGDFGRKVRNLGLVASAAGAGAFMLVKSYADLGETLNLTSQKTGVSVENLQKLGYAAELDKISADELGASLQFLNRNMELAKTAPDSQQGKMFKALGIDVTKTTDAYEVLMKMSDKFSKSTNVGEKNLFARALMGRGGTNLIPLLNQGSKAIQDLGAEYEKLGHVMSAESATAADNLGDNLQRLAVVGKGFSGMLAEQLVPILNPLIVQFTEWVGSNKDLVKSNINSFVSGTVTVFKALFQVLSALKLIITPIVDAFGGLGTVVKLLAGVYIASLIASFSRLVYSIGVFGAALVGYIPAMYAAAAANWAFVAPLLVAAIPILGIAAAIGLVGFAIYKLITGFSEFKAAWFALWPQLAEPAKAAVSMIMSSFTVALSGLGNIFGINFEAIKAKVSGIVDWIITKFQAVKSLLGFGDSQESGASVNKAANDVNKLQTTVQATGEKASTLGTFFAEASQKTIMAMNPVLGLLLQVSEAVDRIKASSSMKPISIGVTTPLVPPANVTGAASPAGSAAAIPAKTLLTPPASSAQIASAQSSRTKLDVYMKIDAEGRAKNIRAKSSANMDFAANTGVML